MGDLLAAVHPLGPGGLLLLLRVGSAVCGLACGGLARRGCTGIVRKIRSSRHERNWSSSALLRKHQKRRGGWRPVRWSWRHCQGQPPRLWPRRPQRWNPPGTPTARCQPLRWRHAPRHRPASRRLAPCVPRRLRRRPRRSRRHRWRRPCRQRRQQHRPSRPRQAEAHRTPGRWRCRGRRCPAPAARARPASRPAHGRWMVHRDALGTRRTDPNRCRR